MRKVIVLTSLLAACSGTAPEVSNEAEATNVAGAIVSADGGQRKDPKGTRYFVNCHMGSCSWWLKQDVSNVETRNGDRLLRVVGVEGEKTFSDGEDLPSGVAQSSGVRWMKPATIYAHCSRQKPAIIVKAGKAYKAYLLTLAEYPPTSAEFMVAQYTTACHGALWSESLAKKALYRATNSGTLDEMEISEPADIFGEDSPVAAQDGDIRIPNEFVGRWAMSQSDCNDLMDTNIQVNPSGIQFWESMAVVESIKRSTNGLLVKARFNGEGSVWSETMNMRMDNDNLVIDGEKRVRCERQ